LIEPSAVSFRSDAKTLKSASKSKNNSQKKLKTVQAKGTMDCPEDENGNPINMEDKDACNEHRTFKYISRNTQKFDDDASDCALDPPSEDEGENINKTSEAYLEKQKAKIEKEMLRTEQQLEAERQKA
jgi:hypothetical protein